MIVECEKCSSKLLFGKSDKAISWCPNCEGLEVIPNTQAVQMIRNDIIKLNEEINKLIITYDKESLLISLYVTREGMLHDNSLDLGLFMTITELIQTVIKMTNNGSQKCIPMSDEFQNILQYAEEFRESKIIMRLLNQGWGKLIKIKKNMMSEYCYKFDDVIKLRGQNAVVFDNNDWTNQWKFTYEWHQVLNNLEENGLYARTTKIDNSIDFKKINEFWNSIRVKIGLELAVGDNKILEIDTLKKIQGKDIISYLRKLDELIEKFPFEITFSEKDGYKKFTAKPVDVVTFLLPLVKNQLCLDNFKEFFFSSIFDFRCLGGILLTSKGLIVGKRTLKIISSYLKAKYYRDYLNGNHDVGYEFEELVAIELKKVGINISVPNDSTKELRNIKDDEKHPTLEIDILGYIGDTLFVIDCKAIVISTEFISHSRESTVRKDLKDEHGKQSKRIKYIQNNMQKFGFNSQQYQNIKNIIVTYNKEPINQINDIKIVCVRELKSLISLTHKINTRKNK